jgi:hypothetical protein
VSVHSPDNAALKMIYELIPEKAEDEDAITFLL